MARPIEGAANRALVEWLAEKLRIKHNRISVVVGLQSQVKVVKVIGILESQVQNLLPSLAPSLPRSSNPPNLPTRKEALVRPINTPVRTASRFLRIQKEFGRQFHLQVVIERELAARSKSAESSFAVLQLVRMNSIRLRYPDRFYQSISNQIDIPMLIVRVPGELDRDERWDKNRAAPRACLAIYWKNEGFTSTYETLFRLNGFPNVALDWNDGIQGMRNKVLEALRLTQSGGRGELPMQSLTKSQRTMIAGPRSDANALLDFQLHSNTRLLQEVHLRLVVRGNPSAKISTEEGECIQRRALDWVAYRPSETPNSTKKNYWDPFLVVEFDGPWHDDPSVAYIDELKDRVLVGAGISVLRCSYKDFPNESTTGLEHQFRRDFVVHAILALRMKFPANLANDAHHRVDQEDSDSALATISDVLGASRVEFKWMEVQGYRRLELTATDNGPAARSKVLSRTPYMRVNFKVPADHLEGADSFYISFAKRWLIDQFRNKSAASATEVNDKKTF